MRVLKFLFTGCIGISVNLGVLHLLVVLGVHYLLASILAVTLSTIVGFVLQKFWTFNAHSIDEMHRQFMQYAALAIVNIACNTLIVYVLVALGHVHYLVAQALAALLVSCVSYFVYKLYIFKPAL